MGITISGTNNGKGRDKVAKCGTNGRKEGDSHGGKEQTDKSNA